MQDHERHDDPQRGAEDEQPDAGAGQEERDGGQAGGSGSDDLQDDDHGDDHGDDLGDDGPEDEWDDERPSPGSRYTVLVGTFVLGLVSGLVVVLTWGAVTGDESAARSDTDAAAASGTSSEARTDGETDLEVAGASAGRPPATRLSRCTEAARTLQASLGSAQPSLRKWSVHVGAMNQLVVGEITLQQAAAFWENTRVGASREIRRFREAMGSLRRRGVDCPRPDMLGRGARALPGCAREVDAQLGALRAVRTSIDTWDAHVHHMDMLRTGAMSAEEATRLWLGMWQRGVGELEDARIAMRGLQGTEGCGVAGSG